MTDDRDVLDAVRSALHSEPRVHVTDGPIRLALADGALTMEGEVDHIAGKKLALEAAARVPGVGIIIDRLHVRPATPMGDGEIRDQVRDALLQEIALAPCTIRVWVKGQPETAREPADATGMIDVRVEDGIVTLDGDVTGLGQKRLAGVLAWWVPGSRDVTNGIGVTPPEQDSEAAVTDAVLQVPGKRPVCRRGEYPGAHAARGGDAGWHRAARRRTQAGRGRCLVRLWRRSRDQPA